MDFLILAQTLDFIGKIMLAVVALLVHKKVGMEKKIDRHVVMEFKTESTLGILSILLFIASYVITLQI